jgi:phosphoesterase RecJ-like protein
LKVRITREIAYNILTSIIVETSSFRMPHLRPETFNICSRLLETGLDFDTLIAMLFWDKSKTSVILSGMCLARCKFMKKGKIAWSIVRREDFQRIGGKEYDVDAVAEEIRAIKSVEVVVLFREETKQLLRVSLRSKGKKNVATIAKQYNGGGHFDVAGCYIPNNPSSIRELLALAQKL